MHIHMHHDDGHCADACFCENCMLVEAPAQPEADLFIGIAWSGPLYNLAACPFSIHHSLPIAWQLHTYVICLKISLSRNFVFPDAGDAGQHNHTYWCSGLKQVCQLRSRIRHRLQYKLFHRKCHLQLQLQCQRVSALGACRSL